MAIKPLDNPHSAPRVWGGKPLSVRANSPADISSINRHKQVISPRKATASVAPAEDTKPELPPAIRAYTQFAVGQFTKGRLIDILAPDR